MWQPWHALANSSSPVDSVNLNPVLSAGGRERASSSACAAAVASDVIARPSTTARGKRLLDIVEFAFTAVIRISGIASRPDDPFMQPRNGIERRQDRPLLPRRNVGGVLAGENDPAVDLAQIVVVLVPHFLGPASRTAQGEGHPMPGHSNPVFELGAVLRMNAGTELDRARHPVRRRHRGEFVGIGALIDISAEQHATAASIEAAAGI